MKLDLPTHRTKYILKAISAYKKSHPATIFTLEEAERQITVSNKTCMRFDVTQRESRNKTKKTTRSVKIHTKQGNIGCGWIAGTLPECTIRRNKQDIRS